MRGSLGLTATSESGAYKLTSAFTPETIKSAKLNRVQIQLGTWEGWVVPSGGCIATENAMKPVPQDTFGENVLLLTRNQVNEIAPLFRRRLHKVQKDWARFSPNFFCIISLSLLSDKITIVLLNII